MNILLIFQDEKENFVCIISLHYNGSIRFLLVNAKKICQFKATNSEIKPYPLCLGNISKDVTGLSHMPIWHTPMVTLLKPLKQ